MRLPISLARTAAVRRAVSHGPRAAPRALLSAVPDVADYEAVIEAAPVSLGAAVKRVADSPLSPTDTFARRHIGPAGDDQSHMLEVLRKKLPRAQSHDRA